MIADGPFGFGEVSVGRQRGDRDSLLNWLSRLTRARKECPEIGTGEGQPIDTGNDAVLGMRHRPGDSDVVIVNNLSRSRRKVSQPLPPVEVATATELLADRAYPPLDPDEPAMRLEPHGFRWLRIGGIY